MMERAESKTSSKFRKIQANKLPNNTLAAADNLLAVHRQEQEIERLRIEKQKHYEFGTLMDKARCKLLEENELLRGFLNHIYALGQTVGDLEDVANRMADIAHKALKRGT